MIEEKKTLVFGASSNPQRYSYRAVSLLQEAEIGHIALGRRAGKISDTRIQTEWKAFEHIHTVTLYVGPQHQDEAFTDYIISLAPKRVIFNPGTENPVFMNKLKAQGIEVEAACTLVLLSIDQY